MQKANATKNKRVVEFGDFQTPTDLALAATTLLRKLGICPRSILEPTCGRGAFLEAAVTVFPECDSIVGVDINSHHLQVADLIANRHEGKIDVRHGDFFKTDWQNIITKAGEPWLIMGNPPWVTSSELGSLESGNVPVKSNFHGRTGIEAITGKSNFDISEWMLLRYLAWLDASTGAIAVLCKTTVARKVLLNVWRNRNVHLRSASIYKIDTLRNFGVSVDACLFVLMIQPGCQTTECEVFPSLSSSSPSHTFGYVDGHVIPRVAAFSKHRHLAGPELRYVWRSGIKHDCSKIMELAVTSAGYLNGFGEVNCLEDKYLYPMLKSSDVANGSIDPRAVMLVTQKLVGENTACIQKDAPMTWSYLERYAELFHSRGSSIYRNKPKYSIFGVGPYTFAPWKIAISGFYKKLNFLKVGPLGPKPFVFDDTIYFLPCWSEDEALFLEAILRTPEAHGFFDSIIHWDEKRPVTVEILKRLSIERLASTLGYRKEYDFFTQAQELPLFATS